MAGQDVDAAKIKAAGEFYVRKCELVVANKSIGEVAADLESIAKALRTTDSPDLSERREWSDPAAIEKMLEDRAAAQKRTLEAKEECNRLGVIIN